MTKHDIITKLNNLDRIQFEHCMKDRWDRHDYELDQQLTREIAMLTAELRKLEAEAVEG